MASLNLHGFSSSIKQINERTTSLTKLVDSIMRGRAQPSSRNEAAAAVSDIRTFVRVWRPVPTGLQEAAQTSDRSGSQISDSGGGDETGRGEVGTPKSATSLHRPSADVLLKLAQVCEARVFASGFYRKSTKALKSLLRDIASTLL